jgi:hypothetical protein
MNNDNFIVTNNIIVLHPILAQDEQARKFKRDSEAALEEAVGLARAINLNVVLAENVKLKSVTPATLLGSGVLPTMFMSGSMSASFSSIMHCRLCSSAIWRKNGIARYWTAQD